MQHLWSCITGDTSSLSCYRNIQCSILVLLLVVHPNDTVLKIKTLSICSALQISLTTFQEALLGFIFGVLAATNIAAGFSVWHLSLVLITIFIDTQICFFKCQLQSYSFYPPWRLLGTNLGLVWFGLGFCFNDASTEITEFWKHKHPFQPIQKSALEPNRIILHLVGSFDG